MTRLPPLQYYLSVITARGRGSRIEGRTAGIECGHGECGDGENDGDRDIDNDGDDGDEESTRQADMLDKTKKT